MASRGFAQWSPAMSQLPGRKLALRLHDLPGQGALPMKCAPWAICRDVLRAPFEQEQIRHDRDGDGAFHPVDLFGDLRLAHTDHLWSAKLSLGYPHLRLFEALELLIDLGQIKGLWIKLTTDPLQRLLMLGMLRILYVV
jgi:hypothetical protein